MSEMIGEGRTAQIFAWNRRPGAEAFLRLGRFVLRQA